MSYWKCCYLMNTICLCLGHWNVIRRMIFISILCAISIILDDSEIQKQTEIPHRKFFLQKASFHEIAKIEDQ